MQQKVKEVSAEWMLWRDMVASDQMQASEVVAFFAEHPDFADWYLSGLEIAR